MRLSVLAVIAAFAVTSLGQVSEIDSQTPRSLPHSSAVFGAIVEQLQKAKQEKSLRTRQKTLSRVGELIKRIPKSAVTNRLESRIERAIRSGVMSDEAEEAIDEAIEIAVAADRLFRQTSPTVDPEFAQATLNRVLNSPEFQIWNPLMKFLQRLSKWLEKPLNWLSSTKFRPFWRGQLRFCSPCYLLPCSPTLLSSGGAKDRECGKKSRGWKL